MATVPSIKLNDGHAIPQLGFGVFQIEPEDTASQPRRGRRSPRAVLDDPVITEIAGQVGRSAAQVVLRWHLQRDRIVFPKSTTPERIKENFELFDFKLESDDLTKIDSLDKGEAGRTGPHPDKFAHVPD